MADVYEIININSGSYLNIRSGPGTGNSVVGRLINGDTAWVVGEKDGWLKLADRESWWISSDYAKLVSADASSNNTASATSTTPTSAMSSDEIDPELRQAINNTSTITGSATDDYNTLGTDEAILAELKKYSRALAYRLDILE